MAFSNLNLIDYNNYLVLHCTMTFCSNNEVCLTYCRRGERLSGVNGLIGVLVFCLLIRFLIFGELVIYLFIMFIYFLLRNGNLILNLFISILCIAVLSHLLPVSIYYFLGRKTVLTRCACPKRNLNSWPLDFGAVWMRVFIRTNRFRDS